jgi:hypothetical protein
MYNNNGLFDHTSNQIKFFLVNKTVEAQGELEKDQIILWEFLSIFMGRAGLREPRRNS